MPRYRVVLAPHYRDGILYPVGAEVDIPEGIGAGEVHLVLVTGDQANAPAPNPVVVKKGKRAADLDAV